MVYFLFIGFGIFVGTNELIPLKLGRLAIMTLGFLLSYCLNLRFKYASNVIFALWLLLLGLLNAYYLEKTGDDVTYSGWAGEIIGNENTTFFFVLLCFIHNSPKYCMFVLLPVYVFVNVLMLYSVLPALEESKNKVALSFNVLNRFIMIALTVLFSQFLLVVQEAELLLKNKNIRKQQKQLVTVFNNQPEGVILTNIKEKEVFPDNEGINIELCNASVAKILGYTPSLKPSEKKSIMKQSSEKMLKTPMFVECQIDSENKIV